MNIKREVRIFLCCIHRNSLKMTLSWTGCTEGNRSWSEVFYRLFTAQSGEKKTSKISTLLK